jgi:hypothetical protein
MRIKSLIAAIIFISVCITVKSQTVVVTDDAAYTTGHASSVLDVKSISKGLLIPRVTIAQRTGISSPAAGLMVFQTEAPVGFFYYNGSSWIAVDGSETKLSAGTNISISGSGTVASPYSISSSGGGGITSYTYASRPASPAAGTVIWCSNCGMSGELQVWDGSAWTNTMGGAAKPMVPTLAATTTVTSIGAITASSGGNVTSDGGGAVTARGVCWSTSANPTIANSKTTDGTGTGTFTSALTGLSPSTTYYVRSYATNSGGTGYGAQVSFSTTAITVGSIYGGGKVAFINTTLRKLLIAAPSDQTNAGGAPWGCSVTTSAWDMYTMGEGSTNTDYILNYCWDQTSIAAYISRYCYVDGHSDWYLPNYQELLYLYNNRDLLGGFERYTYYWTSTEYSTTHAYAMYFNNGGTSSVAKTTYYRVRAVRWISY